MHDAQRVSLLNAMLALRSRRFAPGMCLPSGPLAFRSQRTRFLYARKKKQLWPSLLRVTGYALAELPYGPSVTPSPQAEHYDALCCSHDSQGDAMHDCTVFVINDAGTWMLKRPQDFPRDEIPELIRQARRSGSRNCTKGLV